MKLMHIFFWFFCCSSLFASYGAKQVYIVHFGGHNENKTIQEVEEKHYSYLLTVKGNKEEAKASLLYSYKHSINGFAALLTSVEASKLSALKEVLHVVQSRPRKYLLQTTKSWDFLGLKELNMLEDYNGDQLSTRNNLLSKANYGKDVIVGIIDTGVWPESKSFGDDGMDPIPDSWIGKCSVDPEFDGSFRCNRKIIGAKYYCSDFEEEYGQLNLTYNRRSPRDINGHGTHVASIVSGRKVNDVASLGGFAFGNASGGAPMTRLAIYKVCWKTQSFRQDCKIADIIQAIDDAIADGVHVINLSIGRTTKIPMFPDDLISIALLRATKRNIIVVCSAGNGGPNLQTMQTTSESPWVISVGSGSIDRKFLATLELGNGKKFKGQTVASYGSTNMVSLVYAGSAEITTADKNASGKCTDGSLDSKLVEGKIVLCKTNPLLNNIWKTEEVKRAGGVGIVFADIEDASQEYALEEYTLPVVFLTTMDSLTVLMYITYEGDKACASIGIPVTTKNDKPSPSVTSSSSRGPILLYEDILKPDVIAPGLNILAAWSEVSSPVNLLVDHRRTKYNIASGTSIAAPHVAAVASLLRAIYPDWSSAAIRSAIVTTASPFNNIGKLIADYNGDIATPFSSGFGWLQPTKADDPGLVYDASYEDYLKYLCERTSVKKKIDASFKCPEESMHAHDLNHPSITVSYISSPKEVQRKVTNVGNPKSTYTFEATAPLGFLVESEPAILYFDHTGEVREFTIRITRNADEKERQKDDNYFGYYVWKDDFDHHVRSPIIIGVL